MLQILFLEKSVYSFQAALIVLLVFFLFCFVLFCFFFSSRTKAIHWMDERVKVMNEIIAGMRVIKMYTWEDSFSKWIGQIRKYVHLMMLVIIIIIIIIILYNNNNNNNNII